MGKIAMKKKGRLSKADLARPVEDELQRSIRHRSLNYKVDFDEYDDEDEDERWREKKLKLVLKIPHKAGLTRAEEEANLAHAPAPESSVSASSSSYYGNGNKPFKKRRIDGDDRLDHHHHDGGGDADDRDDHDDDVRSIGPVDRKKERGRNAGLRGLESVPGTPLDFPSGVPLPDRKSLELILDKLQKKDTYGVYAEPVDPEELPDYHEVIEHPMDFATVRKKLGNGAYSNLEHFENDVFLICTNAMHYNAPETIYFKQARSIQDLARKKFQRLRIGIKHTGAELRSEQKTKGNTSVKKPTKQSSCKTVQEPVGSDFSSGATLATMKDSNWLNTMQAGGCEEPGNIYGHLGGSSSLTNHKPEKAEEQRSGRLIPHKFGRNLLALDENHRSTYNISNQPAIRTDSIFTTFEGEEKQFFAVGPHADHAYARSLARFASTLGPVAWKVASRRIEQAIPVGFKYGRGWIGEYEPLSTPVLILAKHTQRQPANGTNLQCTVDSGKDDRTEEDSNATENEVKLNLKTLNSDGKPALCGSTRTNAIADALHHKHSPLIMKPDNNMLNPVGLNCPSLARRSPIDLSSQKNVQNGSEMTTSMLMEMVSRNRNHVQSAPLKHPYKNGIVNGELATGKSLCSSGTNNRVISSTSDIVSNQPARAATFIPHGTQEQGLGEPVQLMRTLAEQAQDQQKRPHLSTVTSSRRDTSSSAATAAAQAWVSNGSAGVRTTESSSSPQMQIAAAAALDNPALELLPSIMRFPEEPPVSGELKLQSDKNRFPPRPFSPQYLHVGDQVGYRNGRQMVFSQLAATDWSRFQVQSPCQGLSSHTQSTQKQEHPPDLNISFRSSGSPVRQSSGMMTDSQQPDLALQLYVQVEFSES